MPVAVQQPQVREKKDPLTQIAQAIGVARDVYGMVIDSRKADALIEENRLEQERRRKEEDIAQQQRDIGVEKDFAQVPESTEGAFRLPNRSGLFLPRSEIARREGLAFDKQKLAVEAKAKADTANKEKGPQKLTVGAASEIGDLQAVDGSINTLWDNYKKLATGMGSGISSIIPGSGSNQYNLMKEAAIQDIGVTLEKGKMTDSDRDFYRGMMPDPWDTESQAQAKINALKAYAKNKINARLQGLEQAGFDVSGMKPGGGSASSEKVDDPELNALLQEKAKREKLRGTAGK